MQRFLESAARAERPTHEGLGQILICTADLELDGFVAPTGQRITDILLRGQDLLFLPAGAQVRPENWIVVAPADVLVVIPPPLPVRREWTPTVEPMGMFVEVGRYRVMGTAHPIDGELPDEAFRDAHAFLPLTEASITREGRVRRADVAIVNLGASGRYGATG